MSYLLQYARRPDSIAPRSPAARVDEHARLNRPGLYGDAFVRAFVEGTTRRRRDHDAQLVLQIADCTNTINLEFSLETAQLRENSLFKVDTLLGALHRFRDGLAAETELAEQREQRRRQARSRAGASRFSTVHRSRRHASSRPRARSHTNTQEGGESCRI